MPEEVLDKVDGQKATDKKDVKPGKDDVKTEDVNLPDNKDAETEIQQAVREKSEEIARKMGWRPKDEFAEDDKEWVDSETYILNSNLIEKHLKSSNKELRREMSSVKQAIQNLRKHDEKVIKAQNEKHRKELEEAKITAIEESDVEKVKGIDKKLKEIDEDELNTVDIEEVENPAFTEWKKNNEWFNDDDELKSIANTFTKQICEQHSNISFEDILKKVDKKMERFLGNSDEKVKETTGKTKKVDTTISAVKAVQAVTEKTSTGKKGKTITYDELPREAKDVCDSFVNQKIITREQYLKEYSQAEEI